MTVGPTLSLLAVLIISIANASLLDIVRRSKRNYPDNQLAWMYWNLPVSLGVYINNDSGGGGDDSTYKRTDTPLHPAEGGSGSGSGSYFFSDSAKRDKVPRPKGSKNENAKENSKVDMEQKSELTAKATKVEVQGDDENGKRRTTVTCQGQKDWLQCPMYHLIKINSAFWGRDEGATCTRSNVEHGLKTSKLCAQDESNTMIKLQNACDGESACELVASPVYFDRTDCPDVYKFLRVNWECAHSESRVKDNIEHDSTESSKQESSEIHTESDKRSKKDETAGTLR